MNPFHRIRKGWEAASFIASTRRGHSHTLLYSFSTNYTIICGCEGEECTVYTHYEIWGSFWGAPFGPIKRAEGRPELPSHALRPCLFFLFSIKVRLEYMAVEWQMLSLARRMKWEQLLRRLCPLIGLKGAPMEDLSVFPGVEMFLSFYTWLIIFINFYRWDFQY